MKVNSVLYEKGIVKSLKGVRITLLSTNYFKLSFSNYKKYLKYKISEAEFDFKLNEKHDIELAHKIEMPMKFKIQHRIARSAVLEFKNGVVFLLSVGTWCSSADLVLWNCRIFKTGNLIIDSLTIKLSQGD